MESQSRRLLAYWAGFVLVTSFLGQETMATSGGVSLGPPQAGLVAHYPFNGNANDQSGGYHGQVLGADLAADRFGAPGRAYYFDGDHFDRIAVNLPALQQITFTVWVKTLDVVSGGGAGRLLKVEPECFDIAVNNSTGNGEEIAVQAGLGWASTQVRSEKNQWNFFAFDCNGTVLRVHKNGILVATLPASASSISPRAFGAYTANRGDDLHGYLDDIRIYNRVLTTAEIGQIHQAESSPWPWISLLGSNPLEVYQGSVYVDPGAVLIDNVDPSRILQGSGTVDTSTVGSYTLTYAGMDAEGNSAQPVFRTVNVVLNPGGDEDGDGLTNGAELSGGTNPYQKDSDGDGVNDPVERADGTNPSDGNSFHTLGQGLVAHYPLNQDFLDASGNGYHGTGGAVFISDSHGSGNGSLKCDPLANGIPTVSFGPQAACTILFWFKATNPSSWPKGDLFGIYQLSSAGLPSTENLVTLSFDHEPYYTGTDPRLWLKVGNHLIDGFGGASGTITWPPTPPPPGPIFARSGWHQVALKFEGDAWTLHINRTRLYPNYSILFSGNPALVASSWRAMIGGRAEGFLLDDVRIYSRVLSESEMATHYTSFPDGQPPEITLLGTNPLQIIHGSPFVDPGATATDDIDSSVAVLVTGSVDTSQIGTYTLTYSAQDAAGNSAAPVTRVVQVIPDPAGDDDHDGAIYSLEISCGTDPQNADTDGDGLLDGYELGFGRYVVVPGHFTWEQARRDAETKGGHLLTVSHAQEWQMVQDRLGAAMPSENYWMGGTDSLGEGNWIWVTGERWTYTHWAVHSGFTGGGTITLGGGGTLTSASLAGEGFVNLGDGSLTIFPPTLILPPGGFIPISSNEPNGGSSENYLGGRLSPLGGIFWGSQSKAWGDFGDQVFSSYILERGAHTSATLPDTDGDGANDKAEIDAGTDPNDSSMDPAQLITPLAGLDVSAEPSEWTSGGPAWRTRIGALLSHDLFDVATSGSADGQTSWIQRSFTGPAYVEFWWRGSSEQSYDFFSYSVDGTLHERHSGERDWQKVSLFLAAGSHTIRWSYEKDDSFASGQDCVFIDQLTFTPAVADLRVSQGGGPLSSPWTIDFGSVLEGSSNVDRVVTISNQGNLAIHLEVSVPAESGFQILHAPDWIGPNQSVDVTLRMLPSIVGIKDIFLTILAPGSATPPPLIQLTGEVWAKNPKMVLTRDGVAISASATVALGTLPATVEFHLRNEGTDVLRPIVTVQSGEVIASFGLASEILPGETAPVVFYFAPTSLGSHVAEITLQTNDPNRMVTQITFTGTSVLPNSGARRVTLGQTGEGSSWLAGSGGELSVQGGGNNSQSYLEASYQGPGLLSWSWKTQIQEKNDFLSCTVNGVEMAGISKKNGPWETQVVALPEAVCAVRWSYVKDNIGWTGADRVWLCGIQYRPFTQARFPWQQWLASRATSPQGLRIQAAESPVQILTATQSVAGMPALMAFLGGVDPRQGPPAGEYRAFVTNNVLKYRYGINKAAAGDLMQRPMFSQDLGTWTSRGFAQQIVSEDADRIVVEVSMPTEGIRRGFYRLDAEGTIPSP